MTRELSGSNPTRTNNGRCWVQRGGMGTKTGGDLEAIMARQGGPMKSERRRPVGLATLFGGIIGSLIALWFRKKRKAGKTSGSTE